MRIGIVAYWFNRGQGVVARQLRSALADLGHETFVLARPTRKTNIRPDWIDRDGVWDQAGVTRGSDYLIPPDQYLSWASTNELETVLFDQNYQFAEIAKLRASGVRTIGRFVWEHFAAEHVEEATSAFEAIYSMTACEHERYAELGITSPRVRWGCHPDLAAASLAEEGRPDSDEVRLLFPGGFMSKRKPLGETIAAFRAANGPELRLLIKAQVDRRSGEVSRLMRGGSRFRPRDKRIQLQAAEVSTADYHALMASADACLAPSRWEGLGLHLYEATALGVPLVTNDNPPMNEIVVDGRNGLLVPGIGDGQARSGIPAFRPDIPALTAAIERLRDPELRSRLRAGARERRAELDWSTTLADLRVLIEPRSHAA